MVDFLKFVQCLPISAVSGRRKSVVMLEKELSVS